MKCKHLLFITVFVFFSFVLAGAQTRRIEAKKKGGGDSAYVTHTMSKPEIVFNLEHADSVNAACYSPDGRYIASGSYDHTIKIWEVATGRLLRTLAEHIEDVNSVAYSPNGAYLASGSGDETIKIWEVASGECIKTLEGHAGSVYFVMYSLDGKYLASGSYDKTIKIWDVASGECINTLEGHSGSVSSISYSPDGKYLASASWDKTIKIWYVATGECIKILEGHTGGVRSVVYMSNGKYLASGSQDKTIRIWEVETGECIKTLEGHAGNVYSVMYSPDSRYLASKAAFNESKIWKVETGECIKTLSGKILSYSPDGKYFLLCFIKNIEICKTSSLEPIKNLGGNLSNIHAMAFSPDGRYLYSCDIYGNIKLWDVISNECKTLIKVSMYYVCYSPDGKYVASGSYNKTINLYDVVTGECINTLEGHVERVNSVCYSPDGKYVASGSEDKTVKLWEVVNGRCIKTLEGHTADVLSVTFSPDGKYLASGSRDTTIKIWDVKTGNCLKTLTRHTNGVESVVYSPDGTYLASGSLDHTIKIWKAKTGRHIKTLTGHKEPITSIAYSPDGAYVASGSWDATIKIWNASTGKCINTLTGHTGWVDSVCYSPDGKYLASTAHDNTIKFWNTSTGELLATTLNLKDDEWLTYTPEGFFAGSEWATKNLVHIVDGMRTVGIDQVFDSLYRPDLVSAKLSGEDISKYAQKVNFASLMQTGSAPIARFLDSGDEINNRDVTIEFSIENTGGGIGEVNLLLNGKNIRLYESVPSNNGQTLYFSHTVTLQQGDNTVELYAKNKVGKVESLRARKILNWHGKAKKPNLYIFTVAINKYRDRRLQLKYAVPDAEFILKGFSNQKKSLYQNIVTYNLFDDNVTKDGLKSTFEKLSTQIQADDVFVFYIAGHGITYDEDGDYYYLPSNFRFTSSEAIQKQGISKNDLTRYLSLIKAGKTLILMDTCNAGSFLGNNTRGLSEQTAIDRLTRSTGHATIVASSDDQVAMEGYEGHGIFTYILVEGLTGKADTDGDGFITLQELSAYTEREVPQRSFDKWGYEQIPMRDLRKQDFPIYMR